MIHAFDCCCDECTKIANRPLRQEIATLRAQLEMAEADTRRLEVALSSAISVARDYHETCVALIGRERWQSGRNRDELLACGRKYWKLREAVAFAQSKEPA